jgi:hypothetical protein
MKRIAFWLSWMCAVLAFRLAHYAKDGVGEADEYKVGGTSSDDP